MTDEKKYNLKTMRLNRFFFILENNKIQDAQEGNVVWTLGTPWTTSGPGQPLHVLGKGFPQLAATTPVDQGMHSRKTRDPPEAKSIWL